MGSQQGCAIRAFRLVISRLFSRRMVSVLHMLKGGSVINAYVYVCVTSSMCGTEERKQDSNEITEGNDVDLGQERIYSPSAP